MKRIVRLLLAACLLSAMASMGSVSADELITILPKESETTQQDIVIEPAGTQEFSFADIADYDFYFSSGVGAWFTELSICEDGSFEAHYQDSDMGDTGEGYPNGTLYYSDCCGSFTEPVKVNDTVWTFRIDSIEYPLGFGDEIKDETHYIYTVAYGLDGAEDLYLYLPEAKLVDLPVGYLNWTEYPRMDNTTAVSCLSFYGLYNEAQEQGFCGYLNETASAARQIAGIAEEAESQAAALDIAFENAQNQSELNEISGEIYTVWDDALNTIWGILKDHLDEASMNTLTEDELAWIDEKEAAAAAAGAEVEGGSMYSMVVNLKAAELTKDRVYVLAEYLSAS